MAVVLPYVVAFLFLFFFLLLLILLLPFLNCFPDREEPVCDQRL